MIQRDDLYILTKQLDKAIADYETAKTIDKKIEIEANQKIAEAKQKMPEKVN